MRAEEAEVRRLREPHEIAIAAVRATQAKLDVTRQAGREMVLQSRALREQIAAERKARET